MFIKSIENLKKNFDFVAIGSGPASLSLALELEAKGFSILILEAGSNFPDRDNQDFYKGSVIGNKYFDLDTTRLRCFGGSSQHWGGWTRTLDDNDFAGWPIKKNDLDDYLDKSCKILNIKNDFSNLKINEYINQIKFQFSDVNFNLKYYEHINKSKKIFLSLNTPVLKINGNENTVTSVDLKFKKKEDLRLKVKRLIVGCGGLENSRILLWSQVRSDNNFLKNLKIGNYWMEHPHYEVGTFVGDFIAVKKLFNLSFSKQNQIFLSPTSKCIGEKKILNNCLRFQYQFDNGYFKNVLNDLKCNSNYFVERILKNWRGDRLCAFKIMSVWEQPASYSNFIKLSSNMKDPFGIPALELHWKKDAIEKKSPKVLLNELGNYFISKNIGRIGLLSFLHENNDYYPDTDEPGGHHHLGGTRMGISDKKNDVVDENLQVFGVKNLFIVGSSVFRSGGHANPTLSIVQLSLRLANYLENKV